MKDAGKLPFITEYLARFESSCVGESDRSDIRFVVLDTETTGTDARSARLVSVGAVAVVAEAIVIEDSFEAIVKIDYNTSAVTVHGITREQSASGMDEAKALQALLGYLRDAVIVGHHIRFDVEVLNKAFGRCFGIELKNRLLDTMELTLSLEEDGALPHLGPVRGFSLDDLCVQFNVRPHDRHTAAGDAFITAQIFLRLLRIARRCGRQSLVAVLTHQFSSGDAAGRGLAFGQANRENPDANA
jgi:DNA polymerase-3 subunit epsilon